MIAFFVTLHYEKITCPSIFMIGCFVAKSQTNIEIKYISKHVWKIVIVCEFVYNTRALNSLTLLNLGAAFPKQLSTIVIYKSDLNKFNDPSKNYLHKKVCVTGSLIKSGSQCRF